MAALGAAHPAGGEPTWRFLGEYKELGLVEAARQIMPFGGELILFGGVLSTMSALNATTFSSTRVSFAMGRDQNLPGAFARVHPRTRTPWVALLASGTIIILMVIAIPIEAVAAAADVMFLLLFLQVNVALMSIRRRLGDKLDYGFLVPFVHVLPWVAIVLQLGLAILMFHYSPLAWYVAGGWIVVGAATWALWARKQERKKEVSPVVLRSHMGPRPRAGYRVLVPVLEIERALPLLDFASRVAQEHEGEVALLHVIEVPRQTPLVVGRRFVASKHEEVLAGIEATLKERGVPFTSLVRIARGAGQAIVDEVEDDAIDMVVMAWRGRRSARVAFGHTTDAVLRQADCDVVLLRADDMEDIEDVVAAVSLPEQSQLIVSLAELAARRGGAELEVVHLVRSGTGEIERRQRVDALLEALGELGVGPDGARHPLRVEETPGIAQRLVDLSSAHGLLVIGATREGWLHKTVAGALPERVARRARGRIMLVKHGRHPVKRRVLDVVEFFRGEDEELRQESKDVDRRAS